MTSQNTQSEESKKRLDQICEKRRSLKYDMIPLDEAMELEFREGFKAGLSDHDACEGVLEEVAKFLFDAELELRRHANLWSEEGYAAHQSRCADPFKVANEIHDFLKKLRTLRGEW